MKMTVDLPDDLMRTVKIRAVRENRKLKDMIAELLRRGLNQEPRMGATTPRRVQLPLVQTAHGASPDQEMTPARIAELLLEEESRDATDRT